MIDAGCWSADCDVIIHDGAARVNFTFSVNENLQVKQVQYLIHSVKTTADTSAFIFMA